MNELFAAKLTRQQSTDNVVELDGVFQKHGDSGTYVFSETVPTTFTAQDRVLAIVGITKAVFTTARHTVGRRTGRHRRDRLLLLGHARRSGSSPPPPRPVPSRWTFSPTTASPTATSSCA